MTSAFAAVSLTLTHLKIATLAASNAVAEAAESGDPKAVYDAVVSPLAGSTTLLHPLIVDLEATPSAPRGRESNIDLTN